MQNIHDYKNFLRRAFEAYLEQFDNSSICPEDNYLQSEDADFEFLNDKKWRGFGKEIVIDYLKELHNSLNNWQGKLRQWHTWNTVLATYNEMDAWYLRTEFLESTVYECLFQPSALRDKFTFIATNSVHQIRLGNESNYADTLSGDPKPPNFRQKLLNRPTKEDRLAKLAEGKVEARDKFIQLRNHLDDENYKALTCDFRNRSSHAIAPKLGIGETDILSRLVEQATERKKQPCGGFLNIKVSGKTQVGYGIGGISPLEMESTRIANLAQFKSARTCYEAYLELLSSMLETKTKG